MKHALCRGSWVAPCGSGQAPFQHRSPCPPCALPARLGRLCASRAHLEQLPQRLDQLELQVLRQAAHLQAHAGAAATGRAAEAG